LGVYCSVANAFCRQLNALRRLRVRDVVRYGVGGLSQHGSAVDIRPVYSPFHGHCSATYSTLRVTNGLFAVVCVSRASHAAGDNCADSSLFMYAYAVPRAACTVAYLLFLCPCSSSFWTLVLASLFGPSVVALCINIASSTPRAFPNLPGALRLVQRTSAIPSTRHTWPATAFLPAAENNSALRLDAGWHNARIVLTLVCAMSSGLVHSVPRLNAPPDLAASLFYASCCITQPRPRRLPGCSAAMQHA